MKFNNNNNVALFLIILGTIFFFMFGLPMLEKYQNKENFVAQLNNPNINMPKLDTRKCSTSCCGLNQYPLPKELADPNISQEELKNYIPSNFGCTLGDYNGCVCLTQDDSNYLTNRGQTKL